MNKEEIIKIINDAVNASISKLSLEFAEAQTKAVNEAVENYKRTMSADLLEVSGKVERLSRFTSGKTDYVPSKQELERLMPARVSMSSLSEIVDLCEGGKNE